MQTLHKTVIQYAVEEASIAAQEALANATPTPVTWVNHPSGERYTNAEGVCGFAWVQMFGLDGRTKAGKEIIAAGAHSDYCGGYRFSFSDFVPNYHGQSYERKLAACEAAAKVLNEWGFDCMANGRLD